MMKHFFARFLSDEEGATAIEYALIASLIAIAIITGARTLGGTINNRFSNVATSVAGAR